MSSRCSCVAAAFIFLVAQEYLSGGQADAPPENRVQRNDILGRYQMINGPEGRSTYLPQMERGSGALAQMQRLNIITPPTWGQLAWPNVARTQWKGSNADWGQLAEPIADWPQLKGRSATITQGGYLSPSNSEGTDVSKSSTIDVIAANMGKLLEIVEDIRGEANKRQPLP